MTVIGVTKWCNMTWHWQNDSDGEWLSHTKRRVNWCVSVWWKVLVTNSSNTCASVLMCAWTVTPRFRLEHHKLATLWEKFSALQCNAFKGAKFKQSAELHCCTRTHDKPSSWHRAPNACFEAIQAANFPISPCTLPVHISPAQLQLPRHPPADLQTCRLTGGIFTHHSPIPLRKCFLPGVMRSELYSLPYVSTPNVSCLTEMVREREKKHIIICESRFQICVFTVRWWSGPISPHRFKSEWKLVQLV